MRERIGRSSYSKLHRLYENDRTPSSEAVPDCHPYRITNSEDSPLNDSPLTACTGLGERLLSHSESVDFGTPVAFEMEASVSPCSFIRAFKTFLITNSFSIFFNNLKSNLPRRQSRDGFQELEQKNDFTEMCLITRPSEFCGVFRQKKPSDRKSLIFA